MLRSLALAGLALAATSSLAGPYDQPYSIVEAADRSAAREEFPVAITQVDGASTKSPRTSDAIAPGKHKVTVRFQTGRVAQSPAEESRELDLDLKPCTRYRVAAARKGSVNWEPKVYEERIGECERKFKAKSG